MVSSPDSLRANLGRGSSQFNPSQFAIDPLQYKPDFGDIWGAAINQGEQYTLGRSLYRRGELELGTGDGKKLSVEDANKQYGLDLKPSFAKEVSTSLAESLSRQKQQNELNQAVLQAGNAGILEQLGGGILATFTDPVELGLGLLMPEGIAAKGAEAWATGARAMRLTTAARWADRAATGVLQNPFVAGAVENAGYSAIASPMLYMNAQALGEPYGLSDVITDIGLGGVVGGSLHALSHGVKSQFGKEKGVAGIPNHSFKAPPVDPGVATKVAESDFANGKPINIEKAVEKDKVLTDLDTAAKEVEQNKLILDEPDKLNPVETPVTVGPLSKTEKTSLNFYSENGFRVINRYLRSGELSTHTSDKGHGAYRVTNTTDEVVDATKAVLSILETRSEPLTQNTTLYRGLKNQDHVPQEGSIYSDSGIMSLSSNLEIARHHSNTNHILEFELPPGFRTFDLDKHMPNNMGEPERLIKPGGEFTVVGRRQEGKYEITTLRPKDPEPVHRPIAMVSPEATKHLAPVEQRLLSVTDHETFKVEVGSVMERTTANIAKLADLVNLPETKKLASLEDATIVHDEILNDITSLNSMLPAGKQIPVPGETTSKGIFTARSLTKLGKEIGRINDLATGHLDDAEKIKLISAEHEKLRKDLKNAHASLAQARTKNTSTIGKWEEAVSHLTPQVQHTQQLLRAFGKDVEAPELSFQSYVDSLGPHLTPELKDMLSKEPEKLSEPLYRVKSNIIDNLKSRLQKTKDYVNSIDLTQPLSKFPENDKIFKEVQAFIDEPGQQLTPEALNQELTSALEKNINDMKKLNIFSESDMTRFDKIEESFKRNQEQTKAFKDGSLQAQICALRGFE